MLSKIIAVVGSTASGKTSLGLELAQQFNGEIISVDSRQVYRGMDIGTAKSKGDWGTDLVDPDEKYCAAQFKEYAQGKISEIHSRGHLPILVGGTGMWLKVVIDNFDLASTCADDDLRARLEAREIEDLFAQYQQLDPDGSRVIDRANKRRVVRALEVTILTGRPWSQQQTVGESQYDVLQIGLKMDREKLNARIDARVDEMVASGLVEEVRLLRERYGCAIESMTGIGYRQLCEYLDGRARLEDAIEEIKKATRLYAKKQMTWFRKDKRIQWLNALDNPIIPAVSLSKDFLRARDQQFPPRLS
jgi:tRNA dimethylallyltransferase